MAYTVKALADLSGVTPRTLRWFEQLGLLTPGREQANGYRLYGQEEVDRLQQILFYRELGVPLKEIGPILKDPQFDREQALESHLSALLDRKQQLETLIETVQRTIDAMKGAITMKDHEKFEGFKQKHIDENEAKYGREVREKYGDDVVNAANARVKGMSEAQWQWAKDLSEAIDRALTDAMAQGDPAGEKARQVCELHREWLCLYWPEGLYSAEAHKGLADGYVADERFTAYYDKIAPGAAKFLRDAIYHWCGKA